MNVARQCACSPVHPQLRALDTRIKFERGGFHRIDPRNLKVVHWGKALDTLTSSARPKIGLTSRTAAAAVQKALSTFKKKKGEYTIVHDALDGSSYYGVSVVSGKGPAKGKRDTRILTVYCYANERVMDELYTSKKRARKMRKGKQMEKMEIATAQDAHDANNKPVQTMRDRPAQGGWKHICYFCSHAALVVVPHT